MSCRLEQVSGFMAGPVELLHRACFPEDPWDSLAIVEIIHRRIFRPHRLGGRNARRVRFGARPAQRV